MKNIKTITLPIVSLFLLSILPISSLANDADTEELTVIGKRRQDTYERRVNVSDQGNSNQTAQQKKYKACMEKRRDINNVCLKNSADELFNTQTICVEIGAVGASAVVLGTNMEAKNKKVKILKTLIILAGSVTAVGANHCNNYANYQKMKADEKCKSDFEDNLAFCSAILGKNI
jgi:hypothetical protein